MIEPHFLNWCPLPPPSPVQQNLPGMGACRYVVNRNFLFLPWDDIGSAHQSRIQGSLAPSSNAGQLNASLDDHFRSKSSKDMSPSEKQVLRSAMNWLQQEPSRFLYCHQQHSTFQLKHMRKHDFETYFLSEEYRNNMNCYISYVDPWKILCHVVRWIPCCGAKL